MPPPPGSGVRRPAGEPAAVAGGSRALSSAAGALREVARRVAGTTSSVAAAGVWKGPASEAFSADSTGSRARLERAAGSLDQAAAALAELAARLEHAQASWDRARRLAAVVGVELDPAGGTHAAGLRSGVSSPAMAVDPAASLVAGEALGIAEAAGQDAAAARRTAAARLDEAAAAMAGAAGHGAAPGPGHRHGGPVQRALSRGLELGAEVATATHQLVSAAEARVAAAGRLAAAADDPAVRAAARRVAETAGRPMVDGRIIGALPLAAPVLDVTAAMGHGEPLPRALAGALGSAVGADLGGRIGLAACGGEAAATEGVGLIVCPTSTALGGVLGAQAGRAAFLHVYDELTGPADPDPAPEGAVRPEPGPGR
jgi:uncharacterized protein YukE